LDNKVFNDHMIFRRRF